MIAGLSESFYAIVKQRRFPNPLVAELVRMRLLDGATDDASATGDDPVR